VSKDPVLIFYCPPATVVAAPTYLLFWPPCAAFQQKLQRLVFQGSLFKANLSGVLVMAMALSEKSFGSASGSKGDDKPRLLDLPPETLEAVFGYVRHRRRRSRMRVVLVGVCADLWWPGVF